MFLKNVIYFTEIVVGIYAFLKILNSNRNKLQLDPNQHIILVDSIIYSNIELLGRPILEEIIPACAKIIQKE